MSARQRPATFRAEVEAHTVGRWIVPAHRATIAAASEAHACELIVGEAQRRAGVPPWKPYRRAGLANATAKSNGVPSFAGKVNARPKLRRAA